MLENMPPSLINEIQGSFVGFQAYQAAPNMSNLQRQQFSSTTKSIKFSSLNTEAKNGSK